MAKKARKAAKRVRNRVLQPVSQSTAPIARSTRRSFFRRVRSCAFAAAMLCVGGWYVGSEVVASIAEADLTKIGNGTPTVVQIHDPQCPVCRALQQQTRAALKQFDDAQLQYVVANIRQSKGKQFATKYKVPHVTLLLFDGQGKQRDVLSGPNQRDTLIKAFRRLLDRSGNNDL